MVQANHMTSSAAMIAPCIQRQSERREADSLVSRQARMFYTCDNVFDKLHYTLPGGDFILTLVLWGSVK